MSDENSSGWELTESDPGVFTYVLDLIYSLNRIGTLINDQGTPENPRRAVHR